MSGFLGTGATLRADLNLAIQVAMGIVLLAGMALARRKKFREHKYCQMTVILLNLILIATIMLPSFHRQVEPQLPHALRDSYYAIATIHAGLGTIAELLGLYIVLVATKRLPVRLRFRRYKPWMRTALAVWWLVIMLGVGTYYIWYVAPAHQVETADRTNPAPERITVTIRNFEFNPREINVTPGTTIEWLDSVGRHTVEADDGSFKSDTLTAGGRFEHRFDQAGTYPYHCGFHGESGGKDMAGTVVVTQSK